MLSNLATTATMPVEVPLAALRGAACSSAPWVQQRLVAAPFGAVSVAVNGRFVASVDVTLLPQGSDVITGTTLVDATPGPRSWSPPV